MEWVWLGVGLIAALAIGGLLYRQTREVRDEAVTDEYRDARTSTLDSQKQMNLESKGPFV